MSDMPVSEDEMAEKVLQWRHLLPPVPEAVVVRMLGVPLDGPAEVAAPAMADWPALEEAAALDRAIGCLLGLAVGEAMGASVEGLARGSFPTVAAPSGGGRWKLAPGAWGDGTAMALCLADSLLACGTVDLPDFLARLADWIEPGAGAGGRCLDADLAVRAAVVRFVADETFPGADLPQGNGALLRMAPLAIFAARDPDVAGALAVRQSRATHAGVASLDACRLFAAQLADALNGADRDAALTPRVMGLCPRVLFVNAGTWRDKPGEAIAASGDVVDTLEAGLWAVAQGSGFRDTVRAAAGLGGNAMGAAAVAGQLAGALYGASSIPEKWLAALAGRGPITLTARELFEARLPAPDR